MKKQKSLIMTSLVLGVLLMFVGVDMANSRTTVISEEHADSIYGGCGTYCFATSCGSGNSCISRDEEDCNGTSNTSASPRFLCPETSNCSLDCVRDDYEQCSFIFNCVWWGFANQCHPHGSGSPGSSGYTSCTDGSE